MNEELTDEDLGKVCIVRNPRAKNVIARHKADFIQITVPIYFSSRQIQEAIEQIRPRLVNLKPKPQLLFTTETRLETMSFSLNIEKREVKNFHVALKDCVLNIICPASLNFDDLTVQNTIRNAFEHCLRNEAKRIFPPKLDLLARQHGFEYTGVGINKSKTRWGSCSSKKKINLSYFCLLLPEYLIDFIILHELCHTIEMNHGDKFWQLLDRVSNNRAKKLTKGLKEKSMLLVVV
ncbi:MAG: hypothetical protein RL662_1379 [Bacteroidota bacterium]|jgi:predicted metal-dependent hydrolase